MIGPFDDDTKHCAPPAVPQARAVHVHVTGLHANRAASLRSMAKTRLACATSFTMIKFHHDMVLTRFGA
ncbi:MAG: hypothetical protein B7X55_10220 [Rhodobacterales bacterium 34-62-10]|nr:MAG: hypothetical protein B7X55_10220 [Rhodobacterales bacterium 34-62-10]